VHKRTEIKQKLKALIIDAIPEVAGRVYLNRIEKVQDHRAPFINIVTSGEGAEISDTAPRTYRKAFRYTVEIFSENKNLEIELDVLSGKIEDCLMVNETLDGVVADNYLTDTDYAFDYDARIASSACKMDFECVYEQDVPYPGVGDDFRVSNVEYSVGGDQTENAIDEVILEIE
jgi:hypothetical protein